MSSDKVGVMTSHRVPERIVSAACPMCERQRPIVFDITVARGAGSFDMWSVCDECAPRASHLLGWLREHLA